MNEKQPQASAELKFGATAIYVANVPAALDFYRRAFGLETRFYDPHFEYGELETGAVVLALGSHRLGERLMPGEYMRSESGQTYGVEIAFFTSDVSKWFEKAVAEGAVPLA